MWVHPTRRATGGRRRRLATASARKPVRSAPPGSRDTVRGGRTAGVGKALGTHPRLAILAPPGGGKSTFLKRLAIAYVDPSRREEIPDDLPKRNWFPLFFRCRELRDLARGSFADLIHALSEREGIRPHAAAFRGTLIACLLTGKALLLVDGLRRDLRCRRPCGLREHPAVRTPGVSGHCARRYLTRGRVPACRRPSSIGLHPRDPVSLRRGRHPRLCRSWHREVVGDTEKVRAEADQLAKSIIRTERIRRFAVNPLLLTTLLLVKRWVGTLPTRRAVLYGKAVEVLLMTWNTEGHDPIPRKRRYRNSALSPPR